MQRRQTLVARLLKARYFPDCGFMHAVLANDASYVWRSILSGRTVLEKGLHYRIGDGESVGL